MNAQIAAFVSRYWSVAEHLLQVHVEPLRGGLESAVVRARIANCCTLPLPDSLVVKELRSGFEREADVYAWLWGQVDRPPAVQVLGREMVRGTYVYLEDAAIRHHLAVLADAGSPETSRYDSGRALVAWHRVVRRVAAILGASDEAHTVLHRAT